ncbi:hypothetical protein DVH26_14470 [Paenibacillus sp. H1-7]|uniref:hypothetical protein n=2 Tax=unclassified Paenibacillus TaxID=185978 RepID=UPI001EF76674|nr:hypothetical protein [Paenibacillus sp. H1-7]ULL15544.1 hypothetical protein DVH26_14470 [Paenibacillus sp. H1-7]
MMEEETSVEKENGYEDLFLQFSSIFERWVKRVLLVLVSLLILSQLLLQVPFLRYYMVKVEQLEGVPYSRTAS